MAASNELQRVSTNLDNALAQLQNDLDIFKRALEYHNVKGTHSELTGLTAGEEITSGVDKERAILLVSLASNLIFYLRGVDDGAGNTITGDPAQPGMLEEWAKEVGIR